jgi:hypothetical protein
VQNFCRKNLALNLVAAVGLAALIGCESTPNGAGGGSSGAGAGSIALVLKGGSVVNTFSYSITGPNMYSGSINVANSATVSATIGGILGGSGYALTLTGTSTDSQTTCAGTSASFTVSPGGTTSVPVTIDCHSQGKTGSISVNGTINICPTIDAIGAAPCVGNTIPLSSSASDVDNGPSPVSYSWTTTGGTLSSATAQNPTLTCTAPGPVTVTLTVTDGDAGCAPSFSIPVTCPSDAAVDNAWVEIGPNNQAIARLLTPYPTCPSITVDSVTSPMTVRATQGTIPLRTTSTDPTLAQGMTSGNSKPSVFTTTTCEFLLPAAAAHASIAGMVLPLPKATVNRVVIVGDTGCRVSIGNVYQDCTQSTSNTIWPWPAIAQAAAAMQPDLVLHVGDYQYRDNPCPAGNTACAGTSWGYGSDTWAADLFVPAAPLLAAAPWVMVRGNHEACNRAGQGWYRYLDPYPYNPAPAGSKTCDVDSNDGTGNFNDPWSVTFNDTSFLVFDSSGVSKSAYSSPTTQPYYAEMQASAGLAPANLLNIWAVHHPVLGYTAPSAPGNNPLIGSPGLQSVMSVAYPGNYYPPNIGLAVHGHVHDFQAFDFASNHPATFVAGNGGDNLDTAFPATFNPNTPAANLPAPNTVVNAFAFSQEFGFMVMDRVGAVGDKNWKFTSYRTNGSIIAVCTMAAPSACSGVCDSTPGSRITCKDGGGTTVGTYDNIP